MEKTLKVYQGSCSTRQDVPKIQLQGLYLKSLGFDIGDNIKMTAANGKIIIKKIEPSTT